MITIHISWINKSRCNNTEIYPFPFTGINISSTQESNQVGDVSDMCGILALFGADPQANSELRAELLRWWRLLRVGSSYLQNMILSELSVTQPLIIFSLSKLLRHRGPDWNGITCFRNCYLAHERLAINGLLSGAQVSWLVYILCNLSSKLFWCKSASSLFL